ncbi:MAG: four helix bundle protein [Acidobacteria bacterium]|nr:four helix bundle protein [Acidobacteriota bacterium]
MDDRGLRGPARCFEDLIVWRKAHAAVLKVYALSAGFPKSETYGLTSQLRRAAVSIPANIAEGFRKRSRADKARFMNIAEGSLNECQYYMILANDLGYGETAELRLDLDEVSRLLRAYAHTLLTPNSQLLTPAPEGSPHA